MTPLVSFFDRQHDQCVFPGWGDVNFKQVDVRTLLVCGRPTAGIGPYCTHHRAIAWHPSKQQLAERSVPA